MSHTFNTVFFDWGGVIADDPGDDFLNDLLRSLGASDAELEEISRLYMKRFMRGHITEAEFWEQLATAYGYKVPQSISQEFMKWTGLQANEDILRLVESVSARGLQTAVLSNVIEPTYNVLHKSGYYDRFDGVIASCEVGLAKPERGIYTLALRMMRTTAERSIFIDDKEKNLVPAAELGFTVIHARSPEQITSDLHELLG